MFQYVTGISESETLENNCFLQRISSNFCHLSDNNSYTTAAFKKIDFHRISSRYSSIHICSLRSTSSQKQYPHQIKINVVKKEENHIYLCIYGCWHLSCFFPCGFHLKNSTEAINNAIYGRHEWIWDCPYSLHWESKQWVQLEETSML